MSHDVARNIDIRIEVLTEGNEEQPHIVPDDAALGEKILKPGEVAHSESGGGIIAENGQNAHPCNARSDRDGNVQFPVAPNRREGELKAPVVVRENE